MLIGRVWGYPAIVQYALPYKFLEQQCRCEVARPRTEQVRHAIPTERWTFTFTYNGQRRSSAEVVLMRSSAFDQLQRCSFSVDTGCKLQK